MREALPQTRLLAALALTWGFALVEALAGWRGGSLALLADAGHMVTDGAALSLAVVAGIGMEAWARFNAPCAIDGALVSVVAVLGLLVNLGVAWMLAHGQENLNLRGAFLHVLGDVHGSVAAIASGLVVLLSGWTPIDPLLSILIGGLVLAASLRLLREALHGLMDGAPFNLDLDHLGGELAAVPGVNNIHDLHVWRLSGERLALSAHVRVDKLADWPTLLPQLLLMA
ncbi:MAG: cation transporter [Rhodocyclales bacterium]|nr:cation transporter [Rhodocyclales bacterium]